mmetsp:Transcript_26591/g.67731  ORF Transcript_26591/g.67731 Transcript_26591/m.67731 type:complete len:163 (-) Transcript_26591:126-614(-)|eukprot:CAMPEP_0202867512 /NCGR_PEP_ID=MMETSP1391-20130828/9478_1 /ASSEMBLY_ACC=CAM_ASM_000867 /TAXON_ID=1034604 /ORGANISM="Chlamydomonas leiostraca, Strain SAG 11-49" /LENGTH=162 /DNA_ID=CAMNT_0049547563 /DNA_START=20 /DNA_END=508 /DNA_ORIENTATION=+
MSASVRMGAPSARAMTIRCQAQNSTRAVARSVPTVARRDVLLGGAAALLLASAGPSAASATKPVTAHSPYVKGPNDVVFVTPTPEVLQGVRSWPTWEHGVDVFPYQYEADEDCYFLQGRVVVTPEGGKPVTIKAGDYVTFPAQMKCTWDIKEPVKKHYKEYF